MKFLYPQFLWALLAISIPIIIHLFNFRRVRRVYFSNVRLLRDVKTETNNFRRLKQLLVLLCRIGAVAFLVFAFAQPYIPSESQKEIQNFDGLVSIYLDNSFSMQSELGNDQYFALANAYVNDLVKVFPKSSRFQLITADFENKEQYPIPSNEVSDRLSELSFSNTYRDFQQIQNRQQSLLKRYAPEKAGNQVFWFSDFQKSTGGDLEKLKFDSLNRYYLVPIRAERNANIMIDSVWLSNPFIKALESNQINVRLRNFSQETYQDFSLKLFIDGQQVSTSTLNLAPDAQATAEFNFTVEGDGVKTGRITFEDFPIVFDNEYFFVINASPKVNILHLYEGNPNPYLRSVYTNESVFEMLSLSANNVDYNRLKSTELIILDGISNLDGELGRSLREFIQNGGTLLLIPPQKWESSAQAFLQSMQVSSQASTAAQDSSGQAIRQDLALVDIQNPFYQGVFERVPNNMNMPYAQPVLRLGGLGEGLLKFKNQQSFLGRYGIGQGRLFVLASPLQPQYTNLAKHAIFVPIMYKIASSSKTLAKRPAYTFQERNIRLRVEKPSKNQVYKLKREDLEIIPEQRFIGDELLISLPEQNLAAGYYELYLDEELVDILAFNYGKAESEMDFYDLEGLKNQFSGQKNVQVFEFGEGKNFIQDFKARNIQVNLWKYALMLVLAFLLLEILLIRLL